VPLRLAFDLDGVLADMQSELVRHATALFGETVVRAPCSSPPLDNPKDLSEPAAAEPSAGGPAPLLHLTSRQEQKLWRHVAMIDGFWESLKEIEPGSVERLAALAREHRWELIFLTKRPGGAGATAQVQTQRWLEARGYPLPSVFVVHGSRGLVAAALGLDFVVDDRPENCVDVVVDSRARAVLVWRDETIEPPAATKGPGIIVVKSVDECLKRLSEVSTSSSLAAGFVGRMARWLKIKNPARG